MKSGHFQPEHIPEILRSRAQWVGFKVDGDKKTPFIADAPRRKASSTNRKTWRSFDTALAGLKRGDFSAIAYALDSDFVGVDIDDCFDSGGKLTSNAAEVISRCASYTEVSFSGEGIHIVLRGTLPGGKGRKLDDVELYTQSRFFICTGNRLPDTPEGIQSNPEVISWLLEGNVTEQTQQLEQLKAISPPSPHPSRERSACSVTYSPEEVISLTLPKRPGERNRRLLDLARGLRFNAGMGDSEITELRHIVRKWYSAALSVIRTKSFDDTWAEFIHAWDRARLPLGIDAITAAWEKSQNTSLPAIATQYDNELVRQLVGLCAALASFSSDGRFFLSTHKAGPLLNEKPMTVWRWMKMLEADKLIRVITKGRQPLATRYRWIHTPSNENAKMA